MAQILLPNELTNGTVADASQVMSNFNAIVDVVNGNLGSDNLGGISGTDVTTTDLNGGTGLLDNFSSRFQAGQVIFDNVANDTDRRKSITFPETFPGSPLVLATVNDVSPQSLFVSAYNITKTGCDMRILRIDAMEEREPDIPVSWIAVYTGAFS